MTTMTHQVATEVIRERTTPRTAIQRPRHTRTVRVLRGLADRLDPRS